MSDSDEGAATADLSNAAPEEKSEAGAPPQSDGDDDIFDHGDDSDDSDGGGGEDKQAAADEAEAPAPQSRKRRLAEESDDDDDDDDDGTQNQDALSMTDGGTASTVATMDDTEADEEEADNAPDEEEEFQVPEKKKRKKKKPRRQRSAAERFIFTEVEETNEEADEETEEWKGMSEKQKGELEALKQGERAKGRLDSDFIDAMAERYNEPDAEDADVDIDDTLSELISAPGQSGGRRMRPQEKLSAELLPTVKDPKMYVVQCDNGREREACVSILRKCRAEKTLDASKIYSAVVKDGLKGKIYVEAERDAYVKNVVRGLALLRWFSVKLVPLSDMPDVMTVQNRGERDFAVDQWVKISKRGMYKHDIGVVVQSDTVNDLEDEIAAEDDADRPRTRMDDVNLEHPVLVKLIPRVDVDNPTLRIVAHSKRPAPRLFFPEEDDDMGVDVDSHGFVMWGNQRFKDGFTYVRFKFADLSTKGVTPSPEDVRRFQRNKRPTSGETVRDTLRQLVTAAPSAGQIKFRKGDHVIVVEGSEKNLRGTVVSNKTEFVMVKPDPDQFEDPSVAQQSIPIKPDQLQKFFNMGDHVKVTEGKNKNETGFVTLVEENRLHIITDAMKKEITVLSMNCESSHEVSTGADSMGEYELLDLVQLDKSRVGVLVKFEAAAMRVLDNDGSFSMVQPQSIMRKIISRMAVCKDRNGADISKDDVIHVRDGAHRGTRATVLHVHRNFVFLKSHSVTKHAGVFVAQSQVCELPRLNPAGGLAMRDPNNKLGVPASPRAGGHSSYGGSYGAGAGGQSGRYNAPPAPNRFVQINAVRADKLGGFHSYVSTSGRVGGQNRGLGRDPLIGQRIKIRKGMFKGYAGTVKNANEQFVRVQLDARPKIVQVAKEDVKQLESRPQLSTFNQQWNSYGGSRGSSGAETPSRIDAPETPARAPMTPSRTPRRDGDDEYDDDDYYSSGARTPSHSARSPFHSASSDAGGDLSTTHSVTESTTTKDEDEVKDEPSYGAYGATDSASARATPNRPNTADDEEASAPAVPQEDPLPLWCVKNYKVTVSDQEGGQTGSVVEVLDDNRVRVRVGQQILNVQHTSLQQYRPKPGTEKQHTYVKVIDGEHQGHSGQLMDIDGDEAIVVEGDDYLIVPVDMLVETVN